MKDVEMGNLLETLSDIENEIGFMEEQKKEGIKEEISFLKEDRKILVQEIAEKMAEIIGVDE